MELPTPAPLNSKQSALLRRYWHAGRQGLSSTGGTQALELAALGLIEQARYGGSGLVMCITQAGIVALQAQVEANRARCAPHHDLGATLATWLSRNGRACWTNIELKVRNAESLQLVRPDVFSINATLDPARIDAAVHEVKVSRSDFLADIAKPSKRAGYAAISEKFYYVAPEGLLRPEEMPEDAGLLVARGDDFVVAKRPKKRRVVLAPEVMLAMALKPRHAAPEFLN